MKRTFALPMTALALVASACSITSGSDGVGTTDPGTTDPSTTDPDGRLVGTIGNDGRPVGFAAAALQQFGECSAFLDYVHTEGADRVGPYGLDGGGYYGGPVEVFATDDVAVSAGSESTDATADFDQSTTGGSGNAAPSAAPQARASADTVDNGAGSEGGNFSTTNVQVEGVDEPDIVKTDGDRVLAITGETLHYIDIDGTTGTKRGSIALNDQATTYSYGHEIFMSGDKAFVFAHGEGGYYGDFRGGPEPLPAEQVFIDEPAFIDEEGSTEPNEGVVVGSEDAEEGFVSGFAAPTIEEAPPEDGDIEPAPPVDEPPLPDKPLPVEPGGYFGPTTLVFEIDLSNPDNLTITNTMSIKGRYISARSIGDTARVVVTSPPQDLGFLYPSGPNTEDKAEEANQDIVRNSTIEDWVPTYDLTDSNGNVSSGQLVECSGIHAPADFGGFDMLSIVSLDLGGGLAAPTNTSSVMATGDTVYASQDRMYVSTNLWNPVIDEQTGAWLDENYETAIHRFSIAGPGPATYEASGSIDGHLLNQFSMNDRDGVFYAATTKGAPWGSESSESQIVALEMNGDRLEQVGQVGGLGLGERIFSVRYVDDTAYVVTFRQTDPFYVIDIGDPRAMSVQGELKIPGFSSYLHPIGDGLVLGVGQDATDDGRTTGTKVSLFDVSDPSNPTEVDVWTLPNGFSDAEFDHRAFLYWAETGTAVLPLQSWSDQFAGAVVLHVDANGITEQGRISHTDDAGVSGQTDCRVLTADDLGSEEGSELFWITEGGGQVQLCGANDKGGATGMYCDTIPVEELQYYVDSDANGGFDIDLTGVDHLEFCWADWNGYQVAVQRTMVIDGSLWTLSPERLQANDLNTLDRTAAINL